MKAIEMHRIDYIIAFFFGMFGGIIKYANLLYLDVSFWGRLLEAGLTALVCGFLGVAGKHLYDWIRKKYFKKINKSQ
jgi:hypothetical protein